jgi:hypothetical protein
VRIADGQPEYYHRPSLESQVTGSEKPWIYTSGLRGPCGITDDLAQAQVVARASDQLPKIDADLGDACWKGAEPARFEGDVHLLEPKATLLVRHGADHLFVAFRREAPMQEGQPVQFVADHPKKEKGEDTEALRDDSMMLGLTDAKREVTLGFAVSCAGGGFDERSTAHTQHDAEWNGAWNYAVSRAREAWTAEIAIPLKTLAAEKLDTTRLQINCTAYNRSGRGPGVIHLTRASSPPLGAHVQLVAKPVPVSVRKYTVRLHFAETGTCTEGARTFDVRVQGQLRAESLDVTKAAAGVNRALVKEFSGVSAGERMTVDLRSLGSAPAPILCGLEVVAEGE